MEMLIYLGVGFVVGYLIAKSKFKNQSLKLEERVDEKPSQREIKAENKDKVRGYFDGHSGVTNNDVQELLGVSDATATRYIEELEKEGFIRQIGLTGNAVRYERK